MSITKIAELTTTAGQAAVSFTSIPQTYTDLLLVMSMRNANGGSTSAPVTFNGSSSGYTNRIMRGLGNTADSYVGSTTYIESFNQQASTATANTYSNTQLYIPNYAGATNKSISVDATLDQNTASGYPFCDIVASLWSSTAAITSITITGDTNGFSVNSSATLYGITKGQSGTTTVS
jgi:hypothetical protein